MTPATLMRNIGQFMFRWLSARPARIELTQEIVRELLDYCPETGARHGERAA